MVCSFLSLSLWHVTLSTHNKNIISQISSILPLFRSNFPLPHTINWIVSIGGCVCVCVYVLIDIECVHILSCLYNIQHGSASCNISAADTAVAVQYHTWTTQFKIRLVDTGYSFVTGRMCCMHMHMHLYKPYGMRSLSQSFISLYKESKLLF